MQKAGDKMTVRGMIARRIDRWEHGGPAGSAHDIEYDKRLVAAAGDEIIKRPELWQELQERPWLMVELCFTTVTKDGKTVPFILNEVQRRFRDALEEHGPGTPYLILKGRQQGFTTYITAIQLAFAMVRRNFSGFTVADRDDNMRAIFDKKCKGVYERLPENLKLHKSRDSATELKFDRRNSGWQVAVATSNVGRSNTLHFIHLSEAAFFTCPISDLEEGLLQAATTDAYVIFETTANGFNEFKDKWDSGTCVNLFFPWWLTSEYRRSGTKYREEADGWLVERLEILREQGLDEEQLEWYAWKYTTYTNRESIKQEYPCSAEEAFLFSGTPVFDAEKVLNQIQRVEGLRPRVGQFEYRRVGEPIKDRQGDTAEVEWRLEDVRFVERQDGMIRIHEEPRRKYKDDGKTVKSLCPYVLGGDTAGSGEDYSTGKIVDAITGRTAATLRVQYVDEDVYAEQMLCLAMYYNFALIGVEINFSAHPMRVIHQKYGYYNVFMRETVGGSVDEPTKSPGFRTTPQTKGIIIPELVTDFREDPACEPDLETLREMLTFTRVVNGNGYSRMEAAAGSHDDLVMALAIAHHIQCQSPREWMEPEELRAPERIGDVFGWKREADVYEQERYLMEEEAAENAEFISWGDL